MASSKILTMREAISRYVGDGDSIALGLALEALIPFAAGHEIIRQRRRDLTLIGPISDILFDQLISAGLGYNYRRAAESGVPNPIEIVDHSNFTISLGLTAGALGVPYLPTRTLLGSDIARENGPFKRGVSPFGD